jgi:exoribonuclease R
MSKKPNKKKLKKELSKKSLKIAILSGLKETPTKKVNYKQVSKFLKIKKLGEKLLVYEALSSLVQEGSLVEQKRGSFVLALTDKLIEGVVKNTNKRGVYVELKNEEEVFVEKKDSLFSLKGDVVSLVLLTKKRV